MADDKITLRQKLLQHRQALSALERERAEQCICAQLRDWFATLGRHYKRIGAYWPIRGEVDVRPWLHVLAQERCVALPVSVPQQPLHFLRWNSQEGLQPDAYGIPVPTRGEALTVAQLDCLLVPCVGFTAQGYRLGYGAGFYDRTLNGVLPAQRPVLLGVSFSCGRLEMLPHQPHDVPLDWMATETGIVRSER